jgi:hypothetical protein
MTGTRSSIYTALTAEDQRLVANEFAALGGDVSRLRFQAGSTTGYLEGENVIRIGGDIFPSMDVNQRLARSRLSIRGVLAHELGHLNYGRSPLAAGHFADEMRASVWALRHRGHLLTLEDRMLLAQDAIDRVSEAGFVMSQSKRAYLSGLIH